MGCASARLLAMRLTRLICLGALAGTLVPAATAAAQVQPAGTGEPAYTNSAQNTQWFEWPAVSGAGAYKIRFDYYENNALKASPSYAMPNGGSNVWANWSGVASLQHGGQYGRGHRDEGDRRDRGARAHADTDAEPHALALAEPVAEPDAVSDAGARPARRRG
jgi:hypothetical protein